MQLIKLVTAIEKHFRLVELGPIVEQTILSLWYKYNSLENEQDYE